MNLRSRLQSTLGDAYTIERELGGGGMSRVFLAKETALGRKVVIKVLPDEAAGALSVERFKREIAPAARLQQANIVPVLSAGDMNGLPFFIMPFVEGESLRARLSSGGELPIPEAVGILKEVARALTYAHDQGVVHRDIKPDNVLLSGGTAMVTDFGVAKALSVATTEDGRAMTGTGVTLGTPAYMAPEQASADPNVDHRADIYAFGCLAYELLSGAAPFAGRSPQAMISAHLTEEPDPVERRRTTVSWPLAALVARCLAKNPADRPQNARELTQALDQVSSGPATVGARAPSRPNRTPMMLALMVIVAVGGVLLLLPLVRNRPGTPPSLAVLPFANATGDTTLAYLAEGLSDEIRSLLAAVPHLGVKARSSSAQMAGKGVRDAGARLEVDAVLEGTLKKSQGDPTVVIELVRVRDERTLWSGVFGIKATGSASWRDSLGRSVLAALRVDAPVASVAASGATRGTASDEAYDLFLRGEYFRRRFATTDAVNPLRKAVDIDPGFARAHAALALAYATLPMYGSVVEADAFARATTSAERATSLDPSLGSALLARAFLLWLSEGRTVEAEQLLRRATGVQPNDPEIRVWHAFLLASLGRADEARSSIGYALKLDPLSIDALIVRQAIEYGNGNFRQAITFTRPLLELDPVNWVGNWNVSVAYAFAGRPDSSINALEKFLVAGEGAFGSYGFATFLYAAAGRWDEARRYRALALGMKTNSPNYLRAVVHMAFGEYDSAITAVEKGIKGREPVFNTIWLACEPIFWRIAEDPRFVALVRGLGATPCKPGPEWPIGKPPSP